MDLHRRELLSKKFKTQDEWNYLHERTDSEKLKFDVPVRSKRDVYNERHLLTVSILPYCPTCKQRVVDVIEVYVDGKEARQCCKCKNNIPSFVKSVYQ